MKDLPFDDLALAHDKGVLVPFVGSGLSIPACTSWPDMVAELERQADVPAIETADLIARAERAVRILKNRGHEHFVQALKAAVYQDPAANLPAVQELKELQWPLMITTNYDSLILDRYNERHGSRRPEGHYAMEVVGRERSDCQRVLNSRNVPDKPLLWAIQGFFGSATDRAIHPLARQLAVGPIDYRRQTHGAVFFRRAFAEVYRSRTLLFLGSGMSETYFHDLFDEIVELYGNCSHHHYAFVKKGKIKDPRSFERRFQVKIHEWTRPIEVATAVKGLVRAVKDELRPKPTSWTYWLRLKGIAASPGYFPDIEIIRTGLPKPPVAPTAAVGKPPIAPTAAVVLSAGGHGDFGDAGDQWIQDAKLAKTEFKIIRGVDKRIRRIPDRPIYAAIARAGARLDNRDPRVIADIIQGVVKDVATTFHKVVVVHSMLLASGPRRTYPQDVALVEMIRGYKKWRETDISKHLSLHIHLVDSSLIPLLTAGRIDILSLLTKSAISFWVEVCDRDGDLHRYIESRAEDEAIRDLAQDYDVLLRGWRYSVTPTLDNNGNVGTVSALTKKETLRSEGVFFGSTIRFWYAP